MHGTFVNNIYFCNYIADRPTPPNTNRTNDLEKKVREIVEKRKRAMRRGATSNGTAAILHEKMIAEAVDSSVDKECSCVNPMSNVSSLPRHVQDTPGTPLPPQTNANGVDSSTCGWEGPAVLHHGSLLRFGCISFVFSIVECASV